MKDFASASENPLATPISSQIWGMKYQLKTQEGNPVDLDVTDTWKRMSNALAAAEASQVQDHYRAEFLGALEDFKFLPAGRITAGAGTGRNVTLFNCFVMGTIPDSMDGIMDMLKEAALTMQQGGGIGYDFSTIRPKGAPVKGVAADASGALTFMDVWDTMCKTIMSAGSRRGAMMATMRCDHPDIIEFITAKQKSDRLRNFNLSVLITDPFMHAVDENLGWDLTFDGKVYDSIMARDLWNLILKSTYEYAEPGVIFIDRINQKNNLNYCETIAATNPCGEQPLPPYGACLLGSINTARVVKNPFTRKSGIDEVELKNLVTTAVRMMDNVVDVSKFPLPEQEKEAKDKRRLGLGVTGIANMLAMMEITYGSPGAEDCVDQVMKMIDVYAYEASIDLAIEKGPFPLFDADKFLAPGTHASDLPEDTKARIREFGIRNALLTSIAPTGTISLYAGNVSSGIEPVFANSFIRKVTQKDGTKTDELVEDYGVALYRKIHGPDAELPDYFVTAQTLTPLDHIKMQAAAQRWVDSSISKTVNCPEDISFEDFKAVYMAAWDSGCKGCTTYRPNDVTGSVLSVEPEKPKVEAPKGPAPRGEVLTGKTYKLKWPELPHAFYITINDDEAGNPFEIFITTQNVEAQAWITALTRMISAVFRRGGDMNFIHQELQQIFDPRGGAWLNGNYVSSLISAIGGILASHMGQKKTTAGRTCLSCGEAAVIKVSGCDTCQACGSSKCG